MAEPLTLSCAGPAIPDFRQRAATLRIEPELAIGKLRLFGTEPQTDFRSLLKAAPPAAQAQIEREGVTFAWLAPGEWLLTGAPAAVDAALALARPHSLALAIDITHGRIAFVLAGPGARTAIAGVSPLDTRPAAFRVGNVARTALGETGMFIARLSDRAGEAQFRIIVDQTMAAYAVRLLGEAQSPRNPQ